MSNDIPPLSARIARRALDRINQQRIKGRRRDDYALELTVGALMALNSLDPRPEGTGGVETMAFLVSIRGAAELDVYANKCPPITYSEET